MPEATKPVKCPSCSHEFQVVAMAMVPDSQRMSMELTRDDTGPWSVKTLGETLLGYEKLMRSVAKDLDTRLVVMVETIHMTEATVRFDFILTVPKTAK